MKKALITTLALAVIAISGCASTSSYEPTAYKANHSLAYNIAKAGGLITGIQDASVPRDELERLIDTKTFGAAYVLSGYMSPQLGMTDLQGGLLNLTHLAIGPTQHGTRNSLIAWMPAKEAVSPADAQDKLLSHVKLSIETALTKSDIEFTLVYKKNSSLVYHFYSDEWVCPIWGEESKLSDMCAIKVAIRTPVVGKAPEFLAQDNKVYAFLSGQSKRFNYVRIENGASSHVPMQLLYARISEHMPAYVYVYLAPNKVELEDSSRIKFPYILNEGKPELFVRPE